MRLRKLVPGIDDLEDVKIWGVGNIKGFADLMEDVLDRSPDDQVGLDAEAKKLLNFICYCMNDYIDEVCVAIDRYSQYPDELEKQLAALTKKRN